MAFLQTQREKSLMGITLLAVLLGGGYFLVFKPIHSRYQDLDTEVSSLKTKWTESAEQYVLSKKYRARFNRIRETLSLTGSQQEMKSQINEELTRLLQENQISFSVMTENSPERIDDDFKIYSFSLKGIRTSWETLGKLLYSIENDPAVLEVKKMTVRKETGADGVGMIVVDIDISRLLEDKIQRRTTSRRK
jgi:Tfp pilus assembly protein PilO